MHKAPIFPYCASSWYWSPWFYAPFSSIYSRLYPTLTARQQKHYRMLSFSASPTYHGHCCCSCITARYFTCFFTFLKYWDYSHWSECSADFPYPPWSPHSYTITYLKSMNNYISSGTCSGVSEPVPDEKNLTIPFSPYFMWVSSVFCPFTSCTCELKSVLIYVFLWYTVFRIFYSFNF